MDPYRRMGDFIKEIFTREADCVNGRPTPPHNTRSLAVVQIDLEDSEFRKAKFRRAFDRSRIDTVF